MDARNLAASLLCLLAVATRTVVGEAGPLAALEGSALSPEMVAVFHAHWYVVTGLFLVGAAAFFAMARRPPSPFTQAMSALLAGLYGLSALAVTLTAVTVGYAPALGLAGTVLAVLTVLAWLGVRAPGT